MQRARACDRSGGFAYRHQDVGQEDFQTWGDVGLFGPQIRCCASATKGFDTVGPACSEEVKNPLSSCVSGELRLSLSLSRSLSPPRSAVRDVATGSPHHTTVGPGSAPFGFSMAELSHRAQSKDTQLRMCLSTIAKENRAPKFRSHSGE